VNRKAKKAEEAQFVRNTTRYLFGLRLQNWQRAESNLVSSRGVYVHELNLSNQSAGIIDGGSIKGSLRPVKLVGSPRSASHKGLAISGEDIESERFRQTLKAICTCDSSTPKMKMGLRR